MCIKRFKRWSASAESYLEKHPSINLSALLFAVAAFALYLAIMAGLAIAFAFISITIATFFAAKSLKRTREALELTRATQRPFLNVSRIAVLWRGDGIHPSPLDYCFIGISNTGNFPADQISFLFHMWKSRSRRKHLLQMEAADTSIYFPNVDNPNLKFMETSEKNKLVASPGDKIRVKIEISYYNKLSKTIHKTVRSYITEYNSTARHDPIPIPKEDYWD